MVGAAQAGAGGIEASPLSAAPPQPPQTPPLPTPPTPEPPIPPPIPPPMPGAAPQKNGALAISRRDDRGGNNDVGSWACAIFA